MLSTPSSGKRGGNSAGVTPGGQHYVTYWPQLHPEQGLASGKLRVDDAVFVGLPVSGVARGPVGCHDLGEVA